MKYIIVIDHNEIIGSTYLKTISEYGYKILMKMCEFIYRIKMSNRNDQNVRKFIKSSNCDKYEDIITYNQIIYKVEGKHEDKRLNIFSSIIVHECPLSVSNYR